MKVISLSKGKSTIIDDEDFEKVSRLTWYCNSNGYAVSDNTDRETGKRIRVRLHRLIMNTPKGLDTDHINRNKLDNRRNNLRICSRTQNNANLVRRKNSSNPYKGIEKQRLADTWFARIRVNKKRIYLGTFKTAREAARAYDDAARKYFGEFANTNL